MEENGVLILSSSLEVGGEMHFLWHFFLVFFFYIFFFVDSFTQTKTKAGAFSPCLHLGSCFPPAPENVTPS